MTKKESSVKASDKKEKSGKVKSDVKAMTVASTVKSAPAKAIIKKTGKGKMLKSKQVETTKTSVKKEVIVSGKSKKKETLASNKESIRSFGDMKKTNKNEILNSLKLHFGFDSFKGNQREIIENVLAEKDTFVLMPTGGGKSLCYQLPALLMDGTALVISPMIALMKNQVDAMRNFSDEDGIAHFINSSLNKAAIDEVKADILSGKTKLLYVAPESLTKEENMDFLRQIQISFYAVDEAHCISEIVPPFRDTMRFVNSIK